LAENPTLVSPAGTFTAFGTWTAELELERFTVSPLRGAAAVIVTVHASVPNPVMAPLLQDSALRAAEPVTAAPVPFILITAAALAEELLAIVSCPAAVPSAAGLN
jgi:hypothetical protein